MNWYHGNKTLYPKTYATVIRRSPSGETAHPRPKRWSDTDG